MPEIEKKKVEQELKDLDIKLEKTVDTLMSDDPGVMGAVKAGVYASVCGCHTQCGQLVKLRN